MDELPNIDGVEVADPPRSLPHYNAAQHAAKAYCESEVKRLLMEQMKKHVNIFTM